MNVTAKISDTILLFSIAWIRGVSGQMFRCQVCTGVNTTVSLMHFWLSHWQVGCHAVQCQREDRSSRFIIRVGNTNRMICNSRVRCQKIRHVFDGDIADLTLKKADKARVKFGDFNPLINDQMISLPSLGIVICQDTCDSLIPFLLRAGS